MYWEHIYPGRLRRYRYLGTVSLEWQGELLYLIDIVIVIRENRRHGGGTAVLQHIIRIAEEQQMRGIWGNMVALGEMDPGRLAAWYRRNGFTIDWPGDNRLRLRLPL